MDPVDRVLNRRTAGRLLAPAIAVSTLLFAVPAFAADTIEGEVFGGGAPIAKSTVTLWSAGADLA
jgi:hypothetical protein